MLTSCNDKGGNIMKKVYIEYCTSWGYLGRAVALAESVLNKQKNNVAEVLIIPSSGGVFEVKVDDILLFSKKELNRFPEEGEAESLIDNSL